MLESTRLRQEELRLQNEINDLPEVRLADDRGNAEDTRTAERRRNEGIGGLAAVRPDHRGVSGRRSDAAQAAMATNTDTSGWTAELREFRDLGQRTSIAGYMQATVSEKRVDGAEAEYNDHVFGGNWQQGDYPLEMLLDRNEYFALSAQAIGDMRTSSGR